MLIFSLHRPKQIFHRCLPAENETFQMCKMIFLSQNVLAPDFKPIKYNYVRPIHIPSFLLWPFVNLVLVVILLYVCRQFAVCMSSVCCTCRQFAVCMSSVCCMYVVSLLYVCRQFVVLVVSLLYVCRQFVVLVVSLLYVCRQFAVCMSSVCCMYVVSLLYVCRHFVVCMYVVSLWYLSSV